MESWIPITIAAAFCQNLRSALQKHLTARLSTGGATFVRFFYAFPLAAAYLWGLVALGGFSMPSPSAAFWIYAAIGGGAQILATALLVYLFGLRNFAVGTTFSKTEVALTAIFGLVFLGDPLGQWGILAIATTLLGVMTISAAKSHVTFRTLLTGLGEPTALIGIGSGAMFGVSAVAYRAASLSLGGEGFIVQAAYTLACVTVMQSIAMAIWIRWREPGQITKVLGAWRVAALVGLAGMLGSVGWFTAMTIQNAAYVRALGQVELIFTFASSVIFFKERTSLTEVIGIGLVIGGIVILLLS